jgi:hypothetical protein
MAQENPTQKFIQIKEVREDTLVLNNSTLRGVIMTSSLNFDLKSTEEQDTIIYQFQDFINSLDFSLEIVVQSRRLNITRYLEKLKELEKKHENKLLKAQIEGYRVFIKDLISKSSIMSKNFFVIVPMIPSSSQTNKEGLFKKPSIPSLTEENFKRARGQLMQRMEFIRLGLQRCDLKCSLLGSAELIELLWALHHPEQAEHGYYPEIPSEIIK